MKSDELLKNLERALNKFIEALSFEDTEPNRESLIQRFEYTFELAWKVMSSILADEGIPKTGVRTIIRAAAQLDLITDPSRWLLYADARNRSSHLYLESVVIEVATIARGQFAEDVQILITKARTRL